MLALLERVRPDTAALAEELTLIWEAGLEAGAAEEPDEISAAAKDPEERRRIARHAAKVRWHGHVKKRVVVKTHRGKRSVTFDNTWEDHFRGSDKDRSDRYRDLPHAMNAVKYGTCRTQNKSGEKRLVYEHAQKGTGMKVVCVRKRGKWVVLTFHRKKGRRKE